MNEAPMTRSPDVVRATPLAEARVVCDDKLATGDLSLYHSLLFTPQPQRAAAAALYAFWLEVREIDEECADAAIARVKLAWWEEEIAATFAGRPRHPITVALAPVTATYGLTAEPFHALIDALARHASAAEYATVEHMQDHGRQTRGRLEQLTAKLTDGTATRASEERAVALGAVLELAALLRDVGADARRGRVYLPRAELARFGVAREDICAGRGGEPLRRLVAHMAESLLEELARAAAALSVQERRALLPAVIASEIARRLLRKIANGAECVLRERVRLFPPHQLWLAWRAARAAA